MALTVLAAGAATAGCGGSEGEGDGATAPPARWSLEPDLTYRVPDPLALTGVRDIAVSAEGEAHVLATRLYRVLAFSRDGELLGAVGREGQGPGEFGSPRRVGLTGDTLWIADSGHDRVVLFDRSELSFLGSLAPPASVGTELGGRMPLGLSRDGAPLYLTYRNEPRGPETVRGIDARYVRLTNGGSSGPSVDTILHHRTHCELLALRFGDTGSSYLHNHLCDDDVVAGDGRHDRLIVIERPFPAGNDSSSYRVRAIRMTGEPIWSARVPFRPVRMSEDLWDYWMEELDGLITQLIEELNAFPSKRAALEALKDAVPARPDYLPPIPLLRAGPYGRPEAFMASNGWSWIQRWTAASEVASGHRTWDVLDSEGRWLARLEAPEPVTLYDATGTHAWGVQRNELDVPRVVKFRIVERPEPGAHRAPRAHPEEETLPPVDLTIARSR